MIEFQTRNLSLSAGNKTLLQDFDVTMRAGETWIILGGNGSGKTTLLHTLAGLIAPDNGKILLNGQDLQHIPHRERAQNIGLLFQDYEAVFPGTVLETVLSSRYPYSGWAQLLGDNPEDIDIAKQALKTLGLNEFEQRRMTTLSGGERRRVQLASLLAQTVPIQLLDEPTNHLDLRYQANALEHITASNNKSSSFERPKKLNVIVLHDINQALTYGTHAILLFRDCTGIAGSIGDIVSKESLERLYECELREMNAGGQNYYLPI